jgi:hypothetical protein
LDISPRGRPLLECPGCTDLEILNRGEEPTFLPERRQEIVDRTRMFRELVNEIHGWRMLLEPSLLNHTHILFNLVGEQEEKVNYRNPWTT